MEKKKIKNVAKKEAERTLKNEMTETEFLIQDILGSTSFDLDKGRNLILAVKLNDDIIQVWRPEKKGAKYIAVNTTSYKESTSHLTKEEIIKDIILKAFFEGTEYKKIASKF